MTPMRKEAVLKQVFGYSSFHPGQEELIDAILSGRDALGIMPTGAGKSLCFQIPALMLPGITLVVSPLISLMKDQVQSMVEGGVPAAYFNSSLTPAQMAKALSNACEGKYKIIYVAPERLHTPGFLRFAQQAHISLLAVDEAHCVSQWGQNFRPAYLEVERFIRLLPERPAVAAFTATATCRVRDDILGLLGLRDPLVLVTGFDRPNLYFEVQHPRDKFAAAIAYLKANPGKSGIIYCATRKAVEEVCDRLCRLGYGATRYHAGLEGAERTANQEDFLYDRKPLMVATNAFGMGIDKGNVSFVIHYNMPKDIESYYQEAGRAGRDGSSAECILLYSGQDVITQQFLIEKSGEQSELDAETLAQVQEKERERLKRMTMYCHTVECLRAALLGYFGETAEGRCGNCGSCRADTEETDVTEAARLLLDTIRLTGQRYGAGTVIDVARGSRSERVLRLRLDGIQTCGTLKREDAGLLRDVLRQLEREGLLCQSEGEYPVLKLKPEAREVLEGRRRVVVKRLKERTQTKTRTGTAQATVAAADGELFAALKKLRSGIAEKSGVPAFVVFSDAALRDMCRRKPRSTAEFLEVSGVGQAKLDRYGRAFLEVIRRCAD